MLVRELLENLDLLVPFSWAESWDNSGLLAGHPGWEVRGVSVSLDPTLGALKFCLQEGRNVLISHHPLIFSPLKTIDPSHGVGEVLTFALKNDIALIAMHTNWDGSPRGVNGAIAHAIGLQSVKPLVPSESGAWGLGARGYFSPPPPCIDLAKILQESLSLSRVDFFGDPSVKVEQLALCGGSGGGLWGEAKKCGAQGYFTADVKYHDRLEALGRGLNLFIADHGEMEAYSLDALALVASEALGAQGAIFREENVKPFIIK